MDILSYLDRGSVCAWFCGVVILELRGTGG